jgi:hypothetical protein
MKHLIATLAALAFAGAASAQTGTIPRGTPFCETEAQLEILDLAMAADDERLFDMMVGPAGSCGLLNADYPFSFLDGGWSYAVVRIWLPDTAPVPFFDVWVMRHVVDMAL